MAWGVGGPAWGTTSMPWLFIVDGHGIVRAKYLGVVGTTDVEAILSMIAEECCSPPGGSGVHSARRHRPNGRWSRRTGPTRVQ